MRRELESWVWLAGHKAYYKISSFGRIRATKTIRYVQKGKEKVVKKGLVELTQRKDGYLHVLLITPEKKNHFKVHRLVLESFVGPCPDGQECRHLNDVKIDNRLSNLKWGTHGENVKDSYDNGKRNCVGENNPCCKLSFEQVQEIRRLWNQSPKFSGKPGIPGDMKKLAVRFGVSRTLIRKIITNQLRNSG